MVLLKSEQISIGVSAPDFSLPSVDGKVYSLKDFSSAKILVIMFICNHCPYVKAIESRIIELHRDYSSLGVQVVGICSNDPTDYPDDSPENLLKRWREKAYGFPYLIDAEQTAAKAYRAVCTPDLFVFDDRRKLVYHGQLDDSWQDENKVSRRDLRAAVDRLLAGQPPSELQVPSMGCSIKWRKPS